MNYKNIIADFDTILSTKISNKTLQVNGIKDSIAKSSNYDFKFIQTTKAVQEKVSYFIGI